MAERSTKKTTKKSPAKKSSPRKSTSSATSSADDGERRTAKQTTQAPRRPTAGRIAAQACQELADLTGRELEGVVGLERTEDGWSVDIEVLELRRVPNTTDVLAVYEVRLDERGDLESYRRVERYERGSVREEP